MKHLDWDNIQKSLEALFVLDDYVTDSSKDYLRLIRKKETDLTSRYSIDNGAGDSLDVIFTKDVILIKGFDHESSLNQFAADQWNQDLIDRIYEGIDEKWLNLLTSKEREETTFCIWYDGAVHQNNNENHNDGAWLLAYIFDTFERFQEFVTEYYSFEFDDQLLTKLYTEGTLSDRELAELTHEYQG